MAGGRRWGEDAMLKPGWARGETKAHYPSDTLAFLSVFVSDAFLGELPLLLESSGKTSMLSYRFIF